jgi:hypothetical protein
MRVCAKQERDGRTVSIRVMPCVRQGRSRGGGGTGPGSLAAATTGYPCCTVHGAHTHREGGNKLQVMHDQGHDLVYITALHQWVAATQRMGAVQGREWFL